MAKKTFENALASLEQIAKELEAGNLSLEKSLTKFSEGIALADFCHAELEEARGRVDLLWVKNDTIEPVPFTGEDDGNKSISE